MFRRSMMMAGLFAALAGVTGWPLKSVQDQAAPSPRRQRSGKGGGRLGARKATHAKPHTQRDHGKAARRRRRRANLRRG